MEKELNIVAVCTQDKILEVLLRVINKNETWTAWGAKNSEGVVNLLNKEQIDLVLFDSGLNLEEEELLINEIKSIQPEAIIMQHYGGGSGLLKAEINSVIVAKQNNELENINFIDHANISN